MNDEYVKAEVQKWQISTLGMRNPAKVILSSIILI